jgi:hypothetical protein
MSRVIHLSALSALRPKRLKVALGRQEDFSLIPEDQKVCSNRAPTLYSFTRLMS